MTAGIVPRSDDRVTSARPINIQGTMTGVSPRSGSTRLRTGLIAVPLALSAVWVVKLIRVGRSVRPYAEYWSE